MSDINNTYTCPKCKHTFPIGNKVMHEIYCKDDQQGNIENKNQIKINDNNNTNLSNNYCDDKYYCEKCKITIDLNEMDDHIFSHKIQENEEEVNNNNVNEQNRNNNNSRTGKIRSQQPRNLNNNNHLFHQVSSNVNNNKNNHNNVNNPPQFNFPLEINNFNNNMNNLFSQMNNMVNNMDLNMRNNNMNLRNINNQMRMNNLNRNNFIINNSNTSTMVSRKKNNDGTITEIKKQCRPGERPTITETKYDTNGQIISQRAVEEVNDNQQQGILRSNQVSCVNGVSIERSIYDMPGGYQRIVTIQKDQNGNISRNECYSNNSNSNNQNNRINHSINNRPFINNNNNQIRNNNNNFQNFFEFPNNRAININNSHGLRIRIGNPNQVQFQDFLRLILEGRRMHEHPVDEDILNLLPSMQIKDPSKLDSEKKNCVICLEDYKEGDNVITLPCIHIFHKDCIINWFKTQNSCPICKFQLTQESLNREN